MECFSYVSRQIPCFLGQGSSGFLSLTPRVPRLAHMPSDLLGAGPLQQPFLLVFSLLTPASCFFHVTAFSLPHFPQASLRGTRICSVSLKSSPRSAWGPCPTFPSRSTALPWPFSHTSCPPSSWSSLHPGGLRALRVALCPLLLASGWPQLVYSPLSPCTSPDSGQGLHSAPSPWQLPPRSSLTARFLTTGAPVSFLQLPRHAVLVPS